MVKDMRAHGNPSAGPRVPTGENLMGLAFEVMTAPVETDASLEATSPKGHTSLHMALGDGHEDNAAELVNVSANLKRRFTRLRGTVTRRFRQR